MLRRLVRSIPAPAKERLQLLAPDEAALVHRSAAEAARPNTERRTIEQADYAAVTHARAAFQAAGRTVVDATVSGALTVFDKLDMTKAIRLGQWSLG